MSSGDGWTECTLGHRHWGLFGAAGVLVVRGCEVLVQLRSHHTHNGDTWSVPGGAREWQETAEVAALREAHEEIGLDESAIEPVGEVVDDHGGWSYTTVVARLLRPVTLEQNFESAEIRWTPTAEVTDLPLHPGFASSWPQVHELVARTSDRGTPGSC